MNPLNGIEVLLQSKRVGMLEKHEKLRFGTLISETSHFQRTLSEQSRANLPQLAKYSMLKLVSKRTFIYHINEIDNLHSFIVLRGSISCFIPRERAEFFSLAFAQSKDQSNERSEYPKARDTQQTLKHREEEALLNGDLSNNHVYFSGTTCLFTKLRSFKPGEGFGVYTSFHQATFVAEEDSSVLVIPGDKYKQFFPQEVLRFTLVNEQLSSMFARALSEEESLQQEMPKKPRRAVVNQDSSSSVHPIELIQVASYSSFLTPKSERSKQLDTPNSTENASSQKYFIRDLPLRASSQGEVLLRGSNQRQLVVKASNLKSKPFVNNNDKVKFDDILWKFLDSNDIEDNGELGGKNVAHEKAIEHRVLALQRVLQSTGLQEYFEFVVYDEAKQLFNEGEVVEYYYLVVAGRLTLERTPTTNPPVVLRECYAGEFVGIEEEGSSQRRISACFAEKHTTVLRVKPKDFDNCLVFWLRPLFREIAKQYNTRLMNARKSIEQTQLRRIVETSLKSLPELRSASAGSITTPQMKKMVDKAIQNALVRINKKEGWRQQPKSPSLKVRFRDSVDLSKCCDTKLTSTITSSCSPRNIGKNNTSFSMNQYFLEEKMNGRPIRRLSPLDADVHVNFVRYNAALDSTSIGQIAGTKRYDQLNTFSHVYHKRRNIIAIARFNVTDIDKTKQSKTGNQVSCKESAEGKLRVNEETMLGMVSTEISDDGQWKGKEQSSAIKQIKIDVERQIDNIPKFFRERLWGGRQLQSKFIL